MLKVKLPCSSGDRRSPHGRVRMGSSPSSYLVILALAWRIFISSFTNTFFQPDEYFQSLEIAHHQVFGYGHKTWEWTSIPPIRSIVFPALYMPAYWLLKAAGLDNTRALVSMESEPRGCLSLSFTDSRSKVISRGACVYYRHCYVQISQASPGRPLRKYCCKLRTFINSMHGLTIDQFVLSLSSLFHILALGRTLANSLETALTTLALCYWPWHTSASFK